MRAPYRVIVITGASSGLGASLATAYAGPQTVLGLVARNRERLEQTADACRAAGAMVESAVIDVADGPALAAWLAEFDRTQPVELVIANAGISAGPAPDEPGEPADKTLRQLSTNLIGGVNTIAPLVPAMCARGRGRIAVIASIAGYRGLAYCPGYSASKAGFRVYGEAMRAQLAPYGVGVTVVCPGFFESRLTDRWQGPRPFMVTGDKAARRIKRAIDQGRRRIAFPWPLIVALRLGDLAPAIIGDNVVRRFRFHIGAG